MGPVPDLTPEEFRLLGHQVVDWVAGYRERLPELPVRGEVEPGDIRAQPALWDLLRGLANPDQALLHHGGDEAAVAGEEPPGGETAATRRRG